MLLRGNILQTFLGHLSNEFSDDTEKPENKYFDIESDLYKT